ncbi:methionyl-tRNA formyltransferase [bacterium]|nr:methionyl-tRNA formyltransferase [bacterium]
MTADARLRVAFLGSPALAVPSLEALAGAPDIALAQVVTLGDRRRGRRGAPVPTPVGAAALALELPLRRWEPGEAAAVTAELAALRLDAIVVIAFARLLSPALLAVPRLGCLNLHASLLPWGRGASPIPQAILDGLSETGWSAMLMDAGLDTGPVLARRPLAVAPRWTAGELSAALAAVAPDFLLATLRAWRAGALLAEAQPASGATLTRKLPAEAGAIDWREPAQRLDRRLRALSPEPGCWCRRGGERLGLIAAEAAPGRAGAAPGEVIALRPRLLVACGEGALALDALQPPGRRLMPAAAYLNGRPLALGERLENG